MEDANETECALRPPQMQIKSHLQPGDPSLTKGKNCPQLEEGQVVLQPSRHQLRSATAGERGENPLRPRFRHCYRARIHCCWGKCRRRARSQGLSFKLDSRLQDAGDKRTNRGESRKPSWGLDRGKGPELQAKSGPPRVFPKKALLEHSHAHSFTNRLWLLSCCNGRADDAADGGGGRGVRTLRKPLLRGLRLTGTTCDWGRKERGKPNQKLKICPLPPKPCTKWQTAIRSLLGKGQQYKKRPPQWGTAFWELRAEQEHGKKSWFTLKTGWPQSTTRACSNDNACRNSKTRTKLDRTKSPLHANCLTEEKHARLQA